jgi:hypothetical protein
VAARIRLNANDYKNHEDGDVIRVNEGHLEVLGRWDGTQNPAIALYSPGNWRSATTSFDKKA